MSNAEKPITFKPLKKGKTLLLFDIDGTLAPFIKKMEDDMKNEIIKIKKTTDFHIASVGGSDFKKVKFQLDDSISNFNYIFSENGLQVRDSNLNLLHSYTVCEYLGEEKIKEFVNFVLRYLADIDIPFKRGTFIEYRTGMFNICPCGRNLTPEEREEFVKYNNEHKVVAKLKEAIDEKFGKTLHMKCSFGGQISIDCFPEGWDKTYCLRYCKDYDNIVFFGDKTYLNGNDYEIARSDEITRAYTVKSPQDTIKYIEEVIEEMKKLN